MSYIPPHRRGQSNTTPSRYNNEETTDRRQQSTPSNRNCLRQSNSRNTPRRWNNVESTDRRQQANRWNNMEPTQDNPDVTLILKFLNRIYCINLDRRCDKWKHVLKQLGWMDARLKERVERFSAVDGKQLKTEDYSNNVCIEWDGSVDTPYNKRIPPEIQKLSMAEVGCAMSHVLLWKRLIQDPDATTMLVLEDDVSFGRDRFQRERFARACANAIRKLPEDWGIFYLGLSDRGNRIYVEDEHTTTNPPIRLYRPHYGYHTHAYVITKSAAQTLVEHLPVVGPIDVWLAHNHWFDLNVYCAVIPGEGFELEDGTFEGANLVSQRRRGVDNDIKGRTI